MAFNKLEFEQFLKYVDNITSKNGYQETPPDVLMVEYVKTNNLTNNQIYHIALLLCEFKNPFTMLEFVKSTKGVFDKHFFNWIGSKIYETDSLGCMDIFVRSFPECSINLCIIQKMNERGKAKYLYDYLDSEAIPFDLKNDIIQILINSASLEQIVVLIENYSEFITPSRREEIKTRVGILVQEEQENVSISEHINNLLDDDESEFIDIKPAKAKNEKNNK